MYIYCTVYVNVDYGNETTESMLEFLGTVYYYIDSAAKNPLEPFILHDESSEPCMETAQREGRLKGRW